MPAQTELKLPVVAGFHIKEQIGGGGFSSVYRAANPKFDIVAACKVVALTPQTTKLERKELNKEIQVHSSLKHVNILEFINAVIVECDGKTPWIPGVYMLLEIAAGGDLFDKIAPDVGVDEDLAHLYFTQLVAGMYIHAQGVVHRDLKPENLLLDITGQIKISDFGLCSVFQYKGQTRRLSEQCGSLPYVAPELAYAPAQPYEAEPVDLWGMGVILFTLLCGNTPWDQPTADESPEFARYLTGEILSEAPWNRIPHDALSLLLGMLTVEVRTRMTLPEVLQHPWCQRSSEFADQSGMELAEHLTHALRLNGDLELAEPNLDTQPTRDADRVDIMFSAHAASQFTQSLQLFSQTQSGARYCPHLTRFYASALPDVLLPHILAALQGFGVKYQMRDSAGEAEDGLRKVKIGGYDMRKERFTGYVEVERFCWGGSEGGSECEGSFCIMKREKGSPISWRQLWKALVTSAQVESFVLRRKR